MTALSKREEEAIPGTQTLITKFWFVFCRVTKKRSVTSKYSFCYIVQEIVTIWDIYLMSNPNSWTVFGRLFNSKKNNKEWYKIRSAGRDPCPNNSNLVP